MKLNINPFLFADFYKVGHPFQYPDKTEFVYINWTARGSRLEGVNYMVMFGLQYFIKAYLIECFNDNFFKRPKNEVMDEYKRIISNSLGSHLPTYDHIEKLHDLGYLPIKIKALAEGSKVPMRVPCLTILNTLEDFYWLPNFLETLMSSILWLPCNSATIAYEYRKLLDGYAEKTGMPKEFVQWQGHDFSFRGMSSFESAVTSGMGHLLSFTGTDTIPAIIGLEKYYNANSDKELIGGSVPATEHSVMCSGEKDNEQDTFERLITKVYPNGIVSVVSDTWDLWKVLTEYLPNLKEKVMARNGKLVIRPDSGDPVLVICGNPDGKTEAERKGVVELLWDAFGGAVTEKGFRLLDSHVGAIYGDSITLKRADEICSRLMNKGFASQVVFGIGSFTYQYNTRDTLGSAVKATHVTINEKDISISKNPVTDNGLKKSACGLLQVVKEESGNLVLNDNVSWIKEAQGELQTVFLNGKLVKDWTLKEVRNNLLG
jgi:nicotinamide phosphoribosyltransferase